ncbi:MAG TPA: hypothetical protein PLL98_03230 [Bacillota bacterium]|nr:hypothetical protein [Bacillota bacterium]HOR85480.1 hypothetical protein [Bacillota bacterium]HPL54632.1 hypothetical protein [Bacillota bacterium]
MRRSGNPKGKLKIAEDSKTPSEIYSIILHGVICTLRTIFLNYYVSGNIEALMRYINGKRIISAEEYKRLLYEAKDFYPVIISALFINPLKKHTKNFKSTIIESQSKQELFNEIYDELNKFFNDWLCDIEIDPLLFFRLSIAYGKPFCLELSIKQQLSSLLTPIEEQFLKLQMTDIITLYTMEQVATHLGIAGLDYIDYVKTPEKKSEKSDQEIV